MTNNNNNSKGKCQLTVNKRSVWLTLRLESSQGEAVIFLFMEGQSTDQHLKHTKSLNYRCFCIKNPNI